VPLKQGQCLVKPQQFNQRPGIATGIAPAAAYGLEANAGTRRLKAHDGPPIGDDTQRFVDVSCAEDKGAPIQDATVQGRLGRKATETVAVGLDLVSMDRAIHDSQINPDLPPAEAQFLNDCCVCVASTTGHHQRSQGRPDVCVGKAAIVSDIDHWMVRSGASIIHWTTTDCNRCVSANAANAEVEEWFHGCCS